ncbi:response regulator transcription factor [Hominifimenecus sp. rT4P-3]|uniref:response regulator transcription factor n=1 Tax=Hominifimenecus sp. rT4P-3 TaxID=3242979 RepID=UPI003DA24D93
MYRAIIVDDERKICNLILELGDWERFGIEVAAVCADGEEGLARIQELHPDIVLTDVRMPVYDGLELIRRTEELGISAAFVIISGYKYFEYAYSALKYGVIDYLLKPIDAKQLNSVLGKIVEMLDRKRQMNDTETELRQLSERVELGHRAKMFENLFDEEREFPATQERLESVYQKHFSYSYFQVLFLRTDRDLQQEINLLLAQKFQEAVKRIFFVEGAFHICLESVNKGIGVILNFSEHEPERIRNRLRTLLYDLKETVELFGGAWVSIGAGNVVDCLADLQKSAKEAFLAEQARLTVGANLVFETERLNFSSIRADMMVTAMKKKEFVSLLEAMDSDGMASWFERLDELLRRKPPVAPAVLQEVGTLLLTEMEAYAVSCEAEMIFKEFRPEWEQIWDREAGANAVWDRLKSVSCHFLERVRQEKSNREGLPIRLAKAYINEHYAEPITLEKTAEVVGLSAAYFSTNFKKFEKRTFTDYLTAVRLAAARELLVTTQKTNYEIALSVGYADDKYFCKVFKKEVGIRPGEYRKLYYKGGKGV